MIDIVSPLLTPLPSFRLSLILGLTNPILRITYNMAVSIGLIGVGYWGPNLLRNFLSIPGCEVKLVCDWDEKKLKKIEEENPQLKTTVKPEDIFKADTDAVVIAASAANHFTLVKTALLSNKHTFVEKPLSLSSSEASELDALSRNRKKVLMVGHLLLYHPVVRKLKEIIEKKELGEIYYGYSIRVNLGKIRSDENVLFSLCPHDISLFLYLFNESPRWVFCNGGNFLQKEIADAIFADLYFPSGRLGHIHASWLDPNKIRQLVLVGSERMAVFDDIEPSQKLKIYDKGVNFVPGFTSYPESFTLRFGDIHIPKIDLEEPLRVECEHFIDCINKNKRPLSNGKNGVEVVKVLEALGKSLKERRVVEL